MTLLVPELQGRFVLKGQSGSHVLLRYLTNGRGVTVPRSHKESPIKLGTLKSIIEQAGTTEEDFKRYLY